MMPDDRTLEEMVNDRVAVPNDTLEQRLRKMRFEQLVTHEALLHGVRPRAIRHIIRDAEEVFTLRDDALVPKHGQTDPGDPLAPLSPATWLQGLKESDAPLFESESGRAH